VNKWVWILFGAFFALFFELFCAYNRLALPSVAVLCFYMGAVFGWRRAVVPFILVGSVLDLVLGRTVPFTPMLVLLVSPLGALCSKFSIRSSIGTFSLLGSTLLCVSIFILSGVTELFAVTFLSSDGWIYTLWSHAVFTVSPFILTPTFIFILDKIAPSMDVASLRQTISE